MKVICICLLVFIFGLLVADAGDVCRYGERWGCGSSECEKTCTTLFSDTECTATCTNGCYCVAGFVRTAFGNCSPRYVCRYKSSFRL